MLKKLLHEFNTCYGKKLTMMGQFFAIFLKIRLNTLVCSSHKQLLKQAFCACFNGCSPHCQKMDNSSFILKNRNFWACHGRFSFVACFFCGFGARDITCSSGDLLTQMYYTKVNIHALVFIYESYLRHVWCGQPFIFQYQQVLVLVAKLSGDFIPNGCIQLNRHDADCVLYSLRLLL